jgi:hypothetical protein
MNSGNSFMRRDENMKAVNDPNRKKANAFLAAFRAASAKASRSIQNKANNRKKSRKTMS